MAKHSNTVSPDHSITLLPVHTTSTTQQKLFQQPSFNTNTCKQPMQNPKDISDPETRLDMALELMYKAFKLNNITLTNKHPKDGHQTLGAYDEIEKVTANCNLQDNLQQTPTSGTQFDKAPIYDSVDPKP
ncbi:hypothetical protein Tco_0844102 [Tanacetum coccineum]